MNTEEKQLYILNTSLIGAMGDKNWAKSEELRKVFQECENEPNFFTVEGYTIEETIRKLVINAAVVLARAKADYGASRDPNDLLRQFAIKNKEEFETIYKQVLSNITINGKVLGDFYK